MSETRVRALLTVILLVIFTRGCRAICYNAYGTEPCSYVPAPPGKTPPCAQPGQTYCEYPENYPNQRIHDLIQKWRFDHTTLLKDETRDEFSSYSYPPPIHKHGPYPGSHGPGPRNNINPDSYYPEPIYIPKPNYHYDDSTRVGNSYIPPKVANPYNTTGGFAGYPDGKPTQQANGFTEYKYSMDIPAAVPQAHPGEVFGPIQNLYPSLALSHQAYPYANKIWNRKDDKYDKPLLVRRKRSDRVRDNLRKLSTLHSYDYANQTIIRRKRQQSSLIGEPLCQSRSQFIMPRAALNNKGNWMYVVNMPELDNKYTQLVKSETCVGQTCNAACGLPLGYTSRCEQKYVQKRLVAVEGGGNELYNDVFWIPSCCVCTISNS